MEAAYPNGVMFTQMKPFSYKLQDVRKVSPDHPLNVAENVEVSTSAGPPPTMPKLVNQFMGKNAGKGPEDFVEQIPKLSKDDVDLLNHLTKGQPDNPLWMNHRIGRITASVVHGVYTKVNTIKSTTTKRSKDVDHILSLVMRSKNESLQHIPAVKYGITTEPDARKKYSKTYKKEHKHAKFTECGLFLHRDNQFLGASPDLIVECKCHGKGIVEIKCPFIDCKPKPGKPSYLKKVDGKVVLNRSHPYFTQIQMQLAITERAWCDFYVYNPRGSVTERIFLDEKFWEKVLSNCKYFFTTFVVPYLMEQAVPEVACEDDDIIEVLNSDNDEEGPEIEDADIAIVESRPAPEISASQVAGPSEERPVSPTFPMVPKPRRQRVKGKTETSSKGETETSSKGKKRRVVLDFTKYCVVCDNVCVNMTGQTLWFHRSYRCDRCRAHVHYMCAGIFDEDKWDDVAGEEQVLCPPCTFLLEKKPSLS